ncbi:MAG: 2-hydroxyacyl-CoA dehydratase [Oscillospiraceae bacterium]
MQEYIYPKFTAEMKNTHTILIPTMAPIHFTMMKGALECEGYHVKLLTEGGSEVAQEGLKYVHNDTCYPALLVIGQFISALKSGKYDVDHIALLLTQTGGGCRASNYIHLLRKALVKAGFPQVPVASLNFSGLERDSGFKLSLSLLRKFLSSVYYGDELMCLSNQLRPYEDNSGSVNALVDKWTAKITGQFYQKRGVSLADMKENFTAIADDFALLPITKTPKVKVGIVGEIYVKYSPLGNNRLESFLQTENCEVNMPGLLGFLQYCIFNSAKDIKLYGGSRVTKAVMNTALRFTTKREQAMLDAIHRHAQFHAPAVFTVMSKMADGIIGHGAKMGEGWLLTAEMMELVSSGFENIVCAQPFGCLPNHICGKGMVSKIRTIYPSANITPIDYDPGATKVNQENRIKLMLAVARERLDEQNTPASGSSDLKLPSAVDVHVPSLLPAYANI